MSLERHFLIGEEVEYSEESFVDDTRMGEAERRGITRFGLPELGLVGAVCHVDQAICGRDREIDPFITRIPAERMISFLPDSSRIEVRRLWPSFMPESEVSVGVVEGGDGEKMVALEVADYMGRGLYSLRYVNGRLEMFDVSAFGVVDSLVYRHEEGEVMVRARQAMIRGLKGEDVFVAASLDEGVMGIKNPWGEWLAGIELSLETGGVGYFYMQGDDGAGNKFGLRLGVGKDVSLDRGEVWGWSADFYYKEGGSKGDWIIFDGGEVLNEIDTFGVNGRASNRKLLTLISDVWGEKEEGGEWGGDALVGV